MAIRVNRIVGALAELSPAEFTEVAERFPGLSKPDLVSSKPPAVCL
jgi:hypothetical protein